MFGDRALPNDKDQGTKLRRFSVLDFWISYRWNVPVGELGASLGKSDSEALLPKASRFRIVK
jgi:hypothetical protein